jgi:glycine/D-amino acid oxidase-like deaminating enzyme
MVSSANECANSEHRVRYALTVVSAPAQTTDVLVVGGGIAGAATAYRLAQAGVETVLLDRFDLGTQASGANAGSMHGQIQFTPFRDFGEAWALRWAPTLGLLKRSVEIWRGLNDELGVDVELRLGGGLLVASDERQLRMIERKVAIENANGVASQLLDRDDLRRVAPYVADEMVGGELCPIEGKANPLLATPAFAAAALRAGARIERSTEVQAIAKTRDGFELQTTRGRFRAPRLVLCAGAETAPLACMLGIELPIEGHPMQVNVTEAVMPLVPHLVYFAGDRLTLKQAKIGSLLIGGGWPAAVHPRTGRPTVDLHGVRKNLAVARRVVPAVGAARVLRTWVGVNNGVPDEMPIVAALDDVAPGLVVGTFPYLGFSGGPVMGEILAALARGEDPGFDLAPFSPARFG